MCRKMKLDHQLIPHTRINSKWIRDLSVSHQTIKILQENIGSKISDVCGSINFADKSPRAMEMKEKMNRWDYLRLKKPSFSLAVFHFPKPEPAKAMKKGVWAHVKTTGWEGVLTQALHESLPPSVLFRSST